VRTDDGETRARVLAAAERLFAARGFAKVTVREICRDARANVAAVNYHFGDKQGLYDEVVRSAIRTMQSTTDAIVRAGAGRGPAEQLALYVSIFLERVAAARDGWIHQLMARELSDPTPALDLVLAEVVEPRMAYLRRIVSALAGAPVRDVRVEQCAASIQAQCLAPLTHRVAAPGADLDGPRLEAWAHHITTFSLAGIGAVAASAGAGRSTRRRRRA